MVTPSVGVGVSETRVTWYSQLTEESEDVTVGETMVIRSTFKVARLADLITALQSWTLKYVIDAWNNNEKILTFGRLEIDYF